MDHPFTLKKKIVSPALTTLPVVDGKIKQAEWSDATAYSTEVSWLDINENEIGKTTDILVLAKNDGENLYLAFRYGDKVWNASVDGLGTANQDNSRGQAYLFNDLSNYIGTLRTTSGGGETVPIIPELTYVTLFDWQ
jgi:hypothetical protein